MFYRFEEKNSIGLRSKKGILKERKGDRADLGVLASKCVRKIT